MRDTVLVSVVIPTTGRPSLIPALKSVVEQSVGRDFIEVIVVVDGVEAESNIANEIADLADVVLFTGGVGNGGYARQFGTERASAEWIAFLDDDDEWKRDKLALQLRAVAGAQGRVAVSSRVVERSKAGTLTAAIPRVVYGEGPVEEYLFVRRAIGPHRASIFTSTLLIAKRDLIRVPWRLDLPRHQDWDILIRLQKDGVTLIQLEEVTAEIAVGSAGSISASSRWKESLDWATSLEGTWSRKVSVDFVAAQTLRYALQARSARGLRECLLYCRGRRTLPSLSNIAIGVSGIIPRSMLERAFFSIRSREAKYSA